ncbi:hypothetical protein EDB89DRAFT_1427915 [Lactarius sanguifluus]|nr:hypothetical protein EDB89DRAFT_1427915 [Lactarius sanguifluus]
MHKGFPHQFIRLSIRLSLLGFLRLSSYLLGFMYSTPVLRLDGQAVICDSDFLFHEIATWCLASSLNQRVLDIRGCTPISPVLHKTSPSAMLGLLDYPPFLLSGAGLVGVPGDLPPTIPRECHLCRSSSGRRRRWPRVRGYLLGVRCLGWVVSLLTWGNQLERSNSIHTTPSRIEVHVA